MTHHWKFDARYLVNWFRDGSVFWISCFLFIAILAAIYLLPWELADKFRYAGMLYEIIGLSIVATLVFKATAFLGPIPLYKTWIPYFSRFGRAFYRPSAIVGSGGSASGSATVSAFGTVEWTTTGTLDERVDRLERRLRHVQDQLDRANIDTDQKLRVIEQNFVTERAARETGDRENQRLLTASLIGDSGWEIAGVLFLLAGIVFAGMPNELARFFG